MRTDRITSVRAKWLRTVSRAFGATLLALTSATTVSAQGIYGTMSNFDVFNDTSTDAYGAELELEGLQSSDVSSTFPSHFDHLSITDYVEGASSGTRIRFSGYNFTADGFLKPTVGQSTNGHFCVNVSGCEHFGFSVFKQPTATRYYWLDQNQQRIGQAPMAVPSPTWAYVPPQNGNGNAMMGAAVEVPKAEFEVQKPDSIWMKVYKTEIQRAVKLDELMSNSDVVPEDEAETETEWELLEGGKLSAVEDKVRKDDKAVIRRYEFFRYTGAYDTEHEPLSAFNEDMVEPPADELGVFIAANMVAANLVGPAAAGDFDGDEALAEHDVDLLSLAIRQANEHPAYDLNQDGNVTSDDLQVWVEDVKHTWFGDANLDLSFDTSDLIEVFQAGEYEDEIAHNSKWETGDWNADGEFDTSDLIAAFQAGGYEQGAHAAVAAVPEPATPTGLLLILVAGYARRRWSVGRLA